MKRKAYLFIIMLMCVLSAMAKGKITAHRGEVPGSYNFWLYEPTGGSDKSSKSINSKISNKNQILKLQDTSDPEAFLKRTTEEYVPDIDIPEVEVKTLHTDTTGGKPVVIFLHGASLCGNDLDRVRRYGTIHAIEGGREMDAYVIAPQNPGGSWSPSKIMSIVDWLSSKKGDVDPNRIYVLGMSLGGYGTLDLAAAYPDRIAAAIGMCGGATAKDLKGLNDLPLWIIHGTADNAVPVSASDKVVKAIKDTDPKAPRLLYSRVPGMNHSQPARIFYMPETYEWLFSHQLNTPGRPVTPGFDVTVGALSNAYRGLTLTRTGSSTTKKSSSAKKSNKTTRKRSKR